MSHAPIETDQDWAERELYWRARLRRLRFGAEPLAVQVEKYRRVTIVLSAVSAGIALMFLMIFSAFRRPDIGLILVAILFVPMISLAWLDFRTLAGRVDEYERERTKAKEKVS
jgi:hypothetical protein